MKKFQLYLLQDNPKIDESRFFSIYARKYLGNKTNFIPLINRVIKENKVSFQSIMELFTGTGVLSFYFASIDKKVVANDLLPLNFVLGRAFMTSFGKVNYKKLLKAIKKLRSLKGRNGYFTQKYKNKYIPLELSKKLDASVDFLRNVKNFSLSEKYYLAASLILAVEKSSNIDSDYLSLEKLPNKSTTNLGLHPLRILQSNNVRVYNLDAVKLVKSQYADLSIIDPPFGETDYLDYMNYPEAIIERIFPRLKKPVRSDFCNPQKVYTSFYKLFHDLRSQYLIFFYSNDGLVKIKDLLSFVKPMFQCIELYRIIRKKGLHLAHNKPKTDYLIFGQKNKEIYFASKCGSILSRNKLK